MPEVRGTEVYAGTAAPFNFNGLVRHYFLRRGPNVADVQVNLVPKGERRRQSHAIAVAVRPAIDSLARRYQASAKIAEIPPGPPVLSTLVAEVYAGSDSTRLEAAQRVKTIFETTPGVVDVDWTVEAPAAAPRAPGGSGPGRRSRGERGADRAAPSALAAVRRRRSAWRPCRRHASRWPSCPGSRWTRRSSAEALLTVPIATATGPRRRWLASSRSIRRSGSLPDIAGTSAR